MAKFLIEMPEGWAACGECNFSHALKGPTPKDYNSVCNPHECPLANAVKAMEVKESEMCLGYTSKGAIPVIEITDKHGNPVTLYAVKKGEK